MCFIMVKEAVWRQERKNKIKVVRLCNAQLADEVALYICTLDIKAVCTL